MFCFSQPRTRDNIRIQRTLLSQLRLFQEKPELIAAGRYAITSDVDPEVVDLFFGRVGGDSAECVTAENAEQLRALSDELGFSGFDDDIRAVWGGNLNVQKALLGLRDRVGRHDVIIEELQRQVFELALQLREQRGVPQRVEAVERRVEEVRRNDVERAIAEARREASQASQRDVERIENALREEMRSLDVRGRILAFDEDLREVKRELSSLKYVPRSVEVCEGSVARLREEVSLLKGCESRVRSELKSDIDDLSLLWRATVKPRVFSWMREREAELGRKMVVVRKSSADIYGWLDPDSGDSYCSTDNPGAWIEIEFKAPVRVNGLKVTSYTIDYPRTFDETFSDGPGSDSKRKVSFVDEQGLNGANLSVERTFDAVTAKLVRIEARGPNWDGSNFFNLGGFELFVRQTRRTPAGSFARSSGGSGTAFGTLSTFGRATWTGASSTSPTTTTFARGRASASGLRSVSSTGVSA